MNGEPGRLRFLVETPAESLNVELKNWIDPATGAGQEKVVCAALALRNRNGGYLVIGIDNKTRAVASGAPPDVRAVWVEDDVQALISRFASVPFQITLQFVANGGVELPVIEVPSGVQTPVALKKPLGGKAEGSVFFRTLQSGGLVSTSVARPADWPDIVRICFDNRDADIAAFIRRHLSSVDVSSLIKLLDQPNKPDPSLEKLTRELQERGEARFKEVKSNAPSIRVSPDLGAFEVSVQILPLLQEKAADQDIRRVLASSDPGYGGGVLWYEAPGLGESGLPRHKAGTWENLVVQEGYWDTFDFMRFEPAGGFYQHRLLEADATSYQRGAKPGITLEPGLTLQMAAECITVGTALARGLGCKPDDTQLGILFRWTGLTNRRLVDFTGDMMIFGGQYTNGDDDLVESFITVQLNTQISEISPLAQQATRGLFATFNGFKLKAHIADQRIAAFLSRRG